MKDIHYLNLTNGLEFLPELQARNLDVRTVRIPSTVLERNNWYNLFIQIDNDMLFNLAIGNYVYFYDCGCRREQSKTIFFGVPLLKYVIEKIWFNLNDDNEKIQYEPVRISRYRRGPTPAQLINIYREVFEYSNGCDINRLRDVIKKYEYFRKFIGRSREGINLFGVSRSTDNDSKIEYYKDIAYCNV